MLINIFAVLLAARHLGTCLCLKYGLQGFVQV
jgi:hypothetical protein